MKVFLAEGLEPGEARPEEDEEIELRLVKLSEVLKMIEKGAILDGKTLTSVLLYARLQSRRRKSKRTLPGSVFRRNIDHSCARFLRVLPQPCISLCGTENSINLSSSLPRLKKYGGVFP